LFKPTIRVRLLDTYISLQEEYPILMIYLLIAILQKFAGKIFQMRSDDLMNFIQNLPTQKWTESDLEDAISSALDLRKLYPPPKK
jgi:hypothetical protein